MKKLEQIGMKKAWIYETIVSTIRKGVPHAAPIGVWTHNFETLNSEIYKGTRTIENILKNYNYTVSLPSDVITFFTVLFARQNLSYEKSKAIEAPAVKGYSAAMELRVKVAQEQKKSFLIQGEIKAIRTSGPVKLINRAEGLVAENLVLATKLPHFARKKIEGAMQANHRVIRKVAPGSKYEKMTMSLMDILKL